VAGGRREAQRACGLRPLRTRAASREERPGRRPRTWALGLLTELQLLEVEYVHSALVIGDKFINNKTSVVIFYSFNLVFFDVYKNRMYVHAFVGWQRGRCIGFGNGWRPGASAGARGIASPWRGQGDGVPGSGGQGARREAERGGAQVDPMRMQGRG
jgi:hypothetical protein